MINPDHFHKSQVKFYIILIPLLVLMASPIVFILNHAFKPLDELYAYPPRFFATRLTLDNFRQLIAATEQTGIPFGRYLFNSILSASTVIILSLFLASLAAYAFSFLDFKLKKWIFAANQVAIMFVAVAVAVPRYIMMNTLGVTNSFLAHIVPLIAMPVGVFLVKQFIDQIPNELIEAAKIDGASPFMIYLKIVVPLIKPAIATIAILSFQAVWNNADISATYINSDALKTFAYYMATLSSSTNIVAGAGMSAVASLIMFLPNLIIFIFLQSKVMNTMVHSGIK